MLVAIVVADVKATVYICVRLMLLPVDCGRCYYHFIASLSVYWLMLLPRCLDVM